MRFFLLVDRVMRLIKQGCRGHASRPAFDACICFEPLESRVLLSGSWGVGGDAPSTDVQAEGAFTHHAGAFESHALNRNQNDPGFNTQIDVLAGAFGLKTPAVNTAANPDQTPSANDPASEVLNQTPRHELVLINDNVADLDRLTADLLASLGGRSIEVVMLGADRGGIAQVSDILSGHSNLAAVHVLAHGSEGQIQLGNEWLNSATLQ